MLANIIRYYGHSMQGLMGSYLERSIGAFHEAQKKFQEQSTAIYGSVPNFRPDAWTQLIPGATPVNPMGDFLEKSASSVIGMQEELRKQAMQMFSSFPYATPGAAAPKAEPKDAETAAPRAKSRRAK
jgi:polyhydroxyalkanoate synthesis regulator protein